MLLGILVTLLFTALLKSVNVFFSGFTFSLDWCFSNTSVKYSTSAFINLLNVTLPPLWKASVRACEFVCSNVNGKLIRPLLKSSNDCLCLAYTSLVVITDNCIR